MAQRFDANLNAIVSSASVCRSKIDTKCDQLHALIDEFRKEMNEELENKENLAVNEMVQRKKKVEDIKKIEEMTASLDSMALDLVSVIESKKSKLMCSQPQMLEVQWNDQYMPNLRSLATISLRPVPSYKLKVQPIKSLTSFSATFSHVVPERIAIDKETEILGVTDSEQKMVHLLSSEGHLIISIKHPDMIGPYALCIQNDKVYVTDIKSHYVFIFDVTGMLIKRFGGKGKSAHKLNHPSGIAVYNNGKEETIYVCDTNNNGVSIFSPMGHCIKRLAYNHLITPIDVKFDAEYIYVLHSSEQCIWKFNRHGMLVSRLVEYGETPGVPMDPRAFELDAEGNFYIVDKKHDCVKVFDSAGKWVHSIGNGGEYMECLDVAVMDSDLFILAGQGTHAIHKY